MSLIDENNADVRSAYHEGGHALVALLTKGCNEVDKATVEAFFHQCF